MARNKHNTSGQQQNAAGAEVIGAYSYVGIADVPTDGEMRAKADENQNSWLYISIFIPIWFHT